MAFNTSQFQMKSFNGNNFGNFMSGGLASSIPATNSNTQEDDTYNPRYPWFNKENYEKLERKVSELWLTWSKKQEVMDEFYRQILPQVENEKKRSKRNEVINQKNYEVSQIKDEAERKVAKNSLTVEELAQMVKEKENLREDAPDAAVFNAWIKSIPNWNELLANYMNKGDDTLLYKGWLKEETWWEKAEDFAVGLAQSPWKRGYNIAGQWIDRWWQYLAEKINENLSEESKKAILDFSKDAVKWMWDKLWFDTSTLTDADFEEYAKEKQRQLAEWTAFKGREQTDITKPILWEYRANNWYTKAWEVAWDIASWIALTAPIAAATAPYYATAWLWEAASFWALEWMLDTAITKYWSTWEWATAWELTLWWILWAWWGMLSRYLQNLPKNEADNIRKEASTYIEKSIKPTVKGKMNQADYNKFIDDTLDVVDYMDKNRSLLQYTDDAWEQITWKLPTNLRETSEALGNMKKALYDQYNNIAKMAWDKWARVNMNQAFDKLDDLSKDVSQNIANPQTKQIVENFKNQLLEYTDDAGTIAIEDAQKLTQDFNKQLTAFFRNPNMNDVSKNSIISQLNKWTKDAINESIDDALNQWIKNWSSASQQYQALKWMYGKIKTIEDEVAKRALVEWRKNLKWLSPTLLDAFAWWEATEALLTMNPGKLGKAAVMKFIGKYYKYLNDPNTQINNLFQLVQKTNNPNTSVIQEWIDVVKNAWKSVLKNTATPNIMATTTEALTND